jgi:hypothetical protein
LAIPLVLGTRDRWFKSSHLDQLTIKIQKCVFLLLSFSKEMIGMNDGACKFHGEQKNIVHHREHEHCLICHTRRDLTVAHIWIPRRDKGLGIEYNGVLLCETCHRILDFPQAKEMEYAEWLDYITKMYLMNYYGKTKQELTTISNGRVLKRKVS